MSRLIFIVTIEGLAIGAVLALIFMGYRKGCGLNWKTPEEAGRLTSKSDKNIRIRIYIDGALILNTTSADLSTMLRFMPNEHDDSIFSDGRLHTLRVVFENERN